MKDYIFRGRYRRIGSYLKGTPAPWVYGSLINTGEYCCILDPNDEDDINFPFLDVNLGTIDGYATPVEPDTVGQFTGLTDRNGKRIFEGDIVRNEYGKTRIVKYDYGSCYPFIQFPEYNSWSASECEVIGSIHDEPEVPTCP